MQKTAYELRISDWSSDVCSSDLVVVLCLRYIIEEMDEAQILAIDRAGDVANCAITDYRYDPRAGKSGGLVLQRYNVTAPLEADATEVTQAPDAIAGARG